MPSNQTCVIWPRYSAHGWSSLLVKALQSPLPEIVNQPLLSNSHVILLSGIVPLATASSAANAEILSERSMQRASRIAVSFLVFIAVPPSFTNCRLQARW